MSANSHIQCPNCRALNQQKIQTLEQRIADAYGTVSRTEFEKLIQELEALKITALSESLAQYYEIFGADSGTVEVDYSARCTVCEYAVSFRHSHELMPQPLPEPVLDLKPTNQRSCCTCNSTGKASRGWSGQPSMDGATCPDCRGTGEDATPFGTGGDHCAHCGADWKATHNSDCVAAGRDSPAPIKNITNEGTRALCDFPALAPTSSPSTLGFTSERCATPLSPTVIIGCATCASAQ